MKLAHTIKVSAYSTEGEDTEQIRTALISLIPFDIQKEKISVTETLMNGVHAGEHDITILEIILTKERHVKQFIEFMKEKLSIEQRSLLVQQAASRFDDDLNFYLRFDKGNLVRGEYLLTDSGDCVHIKVSIAAFPKKYGTALQALKTIFQ